MERESLERAHCTTNSGEVSTIDGHIDKKMRWCRLLTVLCIVSQPGGNNWWEDRAGIHKGSPDMQEWVGEDLISKSRMSTRTLRVLCVCLVWHSPCIPVYGAAPECAGYRHREDRGESRVRPAEHQSSACTLTTRYTASRDTLVPWGCRETLSATETKLHTATFQKGASGPG